MIVISSLTTKAEDGDEYAKVCCTYCMDSFDAMIAECCSLLKELAHALSILWVLDTGAAARALQCCTNNGPHPTMQDRDISLGLKPSLYGVKK